MTSKSNICAQSRILLGLKIRKETKMKRFLLLGCLVLAAACVYGAVRLSEMGFIEDIAGIAGKRAYAGDNSNAQYARFANPLGLAIDRWNNIYIADTRNHRIRRINVRTGDIETIAGTGKAGLANDGGNADMAELNGPTALAFDNMGNLYIADTGNQRIRLLDVKGYLHTVAGNGRRGYEGDGLRAKNTSLNNPAGVALDSKGNLFISDTGNNRIRMLDRITGKLTTVAGDGDARDDGDGGFAPHASLNRPTAIIFDKYDNLYIADTRNHKIRFVDRRSGLIFTLAGSGASGYEGDGSGRAADARFNDPTGLALDRFGRIYVSDTDNQRIRRITVDLSNRRAGVENVVGTGKRGYNGDNMNAWDADLAYPGALVINPYDMLYFLDTGNNLLRRVQGVSRVRAPTSYTSFVQPKTEVDSRSFYEVLFAPETEKTAKK